MHDKNVKSVSERREAVGEISRHTPTLFRISTILKQLRKAIRPILLVIAAGALLLVSTILTRTLMFGTEERSVGPVQPIEISDSATERMAAALAFPTIAAGPDRIDYPALTALTQYIEKSFPLVHHTLLHEKVNHSLLYTWKGSNPALPPVLLLGHLDVVPIEPDTEKDWTHPPFSGQIADGFIWGRGAMDYKVGVLAQLEAVETLLRSGFSPERTIYLAFGHDEEVGGQRGARQIAALLAQRNVRCEFVLDEGQVITEGIVPGISDRPVAVIGIAEKGHMGVELIAHESGGHASMPPKQTAVGLLSAAIARIEANPFPVDLNGPQSLLFESLAPHLPLSQRVALANLWLFRPLVISRFSASPAANASIRTTVAATVIQGSPKENVLPQQARAVLNVRLLPGMSSEAAFRRIRDMVADTGIEVSILPDDVAEPSRQSDAKSGAFLAISKSIKQVFPTAIIGPGLVFTGTDSRHYAPVADNVYRFVPVVLVPGDLKRAHGTDERISTKGYLDAVKFYAQLIRNVAITTPE